MLKQSAVTDPSLDRTSDPNKRRKDKEKSECLFLLSISASSPFSSHILQRMPEIAINFQLRHWVFAGYINHPNKEINCTNDCLLAEFHFEFLLNDDTKNKPKNAKKQI